MEPEKKLYEKCFNCGHEVDLKKTDARILIVCYECRKLYINFNATSMMCPRIKK